MQLCIRLLARTSYKRATLGHCTAPLSPRTTTRYRSGQSATGTGYVQVSVFTDCSTRVTPTELISKLPPLHGKQTQDVGEASAILLASKVHAKWLRDNPAFEQALVHHISPRVSSDNTQAPSTGDSTISLLVAVVDKIPRLQSSTINPSDGFALFTSNTFPVVDQSNFVKQPSSSAEDAQDVICFNFLKENTRPPVVDPSASVYQPLANTIFESGSQSTISLTRWQWTGKQVELVSRQNQVNSTLHVNLPHHDIILTIPLLQLCPPREISASTGNVVTRLLNDRDTNEPVPASLELETAVSEYAARKAPEGSLVAAWALILPQDVLRRNPEMLELASMDSSSATKQPSTSEIVVKLLRNGARLHRVLSGGGGWGVKAGLLSLDPDTTYAKHAKDNSADFESGMPTLSFPTVADPGDFIAFYGEEDETQSRANLAESLNKAPGMAFSVLSSESSVVGKVDFNEQRSSTSGLVTAGTFGAIAEGGLSIMFDHNGSDKAHETKLDVPNAYILCK